MAEKPADIKIYVYQPYGLRKPNDERVCRLKKALYRLRGSPL